MSTTETSNGQHTSSRRPTKNEKRRMKKKTSSKENDQSTENQLDGVDLPQEEEKVDVKGVETDQEEIAVEYVAADYDSEAGMDRQLYEELKDVFKKFARPEELLLEKVRVDADEEGQLVVAGSEESKADDQQVAEMKKLSKRKKKLMSRLTVSELKQLVPRPDVVEAHDVTSSDPRLLVSLKSHRCTVPVPRHWCHIRKYLQGKRGVEKIPFQLPEFIADTGIAKIREAIMEQEALKKGKQKARERIRPKMGKIDIDYQVLHDAFFRYQTKPKMTGHGDLYFEGKEFEVQMKEKIPGVISAELKVALGMQDGAPPPWLINMQRYGPPPAYMSLRIPGLNAPLPPGASYGYQLGGWGKPPVDEYGRPLYGDVFGTAGNVQGGNEEDVDKTYRWGGYEYEDEEEEIEEEEEEEEDGEGQGGDDFSGLETPNSVDNQSLLAGLETPDTIDLRKRTGIETPDTQVNRELYHVMQERKTNSAAGGQMFGSDRGYVLPGKGGVQMSINPDELEEMMNDKDKLKNMHEAQTLQSQKDLMFKGRPTSDGTETEEDHKSKKRKAEAPIIHKKVKEFKF